MDMNIYNHRKEKYLSNQIMKSIWFFIAFAMLWPTMACCQEFKEIRDEYGVVYIHLNDSTIIYNTKKGDKYETKLDLICYGDGEDNLKKSLKEEVCYPDDSDDYSYRVFFILLFDSKLRIKEVRGFVLPLNQYSESKKKRDKQYVKKLKRTKNRWRKLANQKWYVYYFSFVTN